MLIAKLILIKIHVVCARVLAETLIGQFEESLIKRIVCKVWAGYKEIAKAVAAPHG